MSRPSMRFSIDFDVAIVGGGLIGATLTAILLKGSGLRVALIEQQEPARYAPQAEYEALRVLAITRASEQIFRALGAWRYIEAGRLGYFREMHVWDAGGSGTIHFDSADLGEPTLGYIIENRLLQSALETVLQDPPIVWYRPAEIAALTWQNHHVQLQLEDGRRLTAKLVVGADGAGSRIRELAGIAETWARDYQQTALVCTVETERPHGEIARQRFLETGPLAFLPLADPHHCSIVWSTTPVEAQGLLALSDEAFRLRLETAFASALGNIVAVGPRAAFPLLRTQAEHYIKPRLALIGDAAHRIHPLAGQGANLGILDATSLAEVVIAARASGRDIGSLRVLRQYERWRKGENLAMMLAMDLFKDLFGSRLGPVRWARNVGLQITDATGPVKRWIMRRAMGLEGDLPRLAIQGRR
jgi:2-octaprenylphenol hydroxylase